MRTRNAIFCKKKRSHRVSSNYVSTASLLLLIFLKKKASFCSTTLVIFVLRYFVDGLHGITVTLQVNGNRTIVNTKRKERKHFVFDG